MAESRTSTELILKSQRTTLAAFLQEQGYSWPRNGLALQLSPIQMSARHNPRAAPLLDTRGHVFVALKSPCYIDHSVLHSLYIGSVEEGRVVTCKQDGPFHSTQLRRISRCNGPYHSNRQKRWHARLVELEGLIYHPSREFYLSEYYSDRILLVQVPLGL